MKEPKPNRVILPAFVETVPGKPVQRWSAARKRDVVLRLLRGESIEAVSRQIGIEPFRLEQWRERALAALDAGLKERPGMTHCKRVWAPPTAAGRAGHG